MPTIRSLLRRSLALAMIGTVLVSDATASELPSAFNGKDFSGWLEPENNLWWKVDEGTLTVASDAKKTGSTLWTDKEYKNFVIEFEYKNGPGVIDSGVFLRNDKEQIQIGISGSLKRDMTASPYIAGKGYPVEADLKGASLKADQWNRMLIVVKGAHYNVWLNDQFVMHYKSETAVEQGPIGLQLHPNNEMAISFRRIRIADLD